MLFGGTAFAEAPFDAGGVLEASLTITGVSSQGYVGVCVVPEWYCIEPTPVPGWSEIEPTANVNWSCGSIK